MSIFKDSWILLKKNTQKDNFVIMTIFSKTYWKIMLKYKDNKKSKYLDIWNVINFEIYVKKEFSINEAKNISLKNSLNYEIINYNCIYEYMNTINILNKFTIINHPINHIYEVFYEMTNYEKISEEKILFAQIKILSILWVFEFKTLEKDIQKIFLFIQKENITEILKLKWLSIENIEILKNIIKENLKN